MNIPASDQRIGEVVEAASASFTAHCYRLYGAPPLGALVRVGAGPTVYGVVCQVTTQGTDPTRRPVARGAEEADEAGVYRSNPQLERLLRTDFQVVTVGFQEEERCRYYLPAAPPRIHAFVHACAPEEVRAFTLSAGFLDPLVSGQATEEVIAACLRQASAVHPEPQEFLVQAGKELAMLLAGQLPQLQAILRRLEAGQIGKGTDL